MENPKILICLLLTISTVSGYTNDFFGTKVLPDPDVSTFNIGMVKMAPKANAKKVKKDDKKSIAKYLANFGYARGFSEDLGSEEMVESIKDFQYFAGLLVTGELNTDTIDLINTERCGQKDPDVRKERIGKGVRKRRFNPQGSKWRHSTLTWRYIHNPQSNQARYYEINETLVKKVINDAHMLWMKETEITFVEYTGCEKLAEKTADDKQKKRECEENPASKSRCDKKEIGRCKDPPDVWLKFVTRYHGDPFPFDGPDGVLAHAFYPGHNSGVSGDVHFDDEEHYSYMNKPVDGSVGRDLMWVTTHEHGHTLGLDHSSEKDAVMYPWYMGYKKNFELKTDDINGIQSIYGPRVSPLDVKKKVTVTKKEKEAKPQCPRSHITAVWEKKEAESTHLVLTKDGGMYSINRDKNGVMKKEKRSAFFTTDYSRGIPDIIDAVFQSKGDDVIFAGSNYYIYQNYIKASGPHAYAGDTFDATTFCRTRRVEDYRNPLNLYFPAGVKVDAAMQWERNKKIYFFTGELYWRYDAEKRKFDCGYPLKIANVWKGLPATIDSAHSDSKGTTFTKDDTFYEFDDRAVKVKRTVAGKQDFLQCTRTRKRRHAIVEVLKHLASNKKRRDINNDATTRDSKVRDAFFGAKMGVLAAEP